VNHYGLKEKKTMKIELPVGSRNLVPFQGIAMPLDVATDTPVQFQNYETQETVPYSRKLIFTRSAVEAALGSIIGMGVCIETQNFNGHAPRSKVGLISESWIERNELHLRGYLYGLDFPDCVEKLAQLRNTVGMCPAFRDLIAVPTADPETLAVTGLTFTGCAILTRRSAHFRCTTARLLPHQIYRWPCKQPNCREFVHGEAQGYCPAHQPKR
jgi:hypothetical protein